MSVKEVLSDAKTLGVKRPASTAQARGDLMYYDSGYAKSASTRADASTEAANQLDFAPIFLGVNQDVRLAAETDTPLRVLVTEGIADFECASATWAVGDFIGIARDAANSKNYDQIVKKTADPNGAIGVCIQAGTSITTVRGKFKSRMLGFPALGVTLETTVDLEDNTAAAFQIAEAANVYMTFDTTDSAENVAVSKKLIINNATTPLIELSSGMTNTGSISIKGKTSGTFKLTTADSTAQTLTLAAAAQTSGAATVSIPDCAGANQTLVTLALAQTLTNKTLTAPTLTGPIATGMLRFGLVAAPVAATGAGGGVAGAAALSTSSLVYVSSDGATKGVKLTTGTAGEIKFIINTSSTACNLFAASGGTINGGSADAGCTIPASKGVFAYCSAADTWIVADMTARAGAAA